MSDVIFLNKVKGELILLLKKRLEKDYSEKINNIIGFGELLDFLENDLKNIDQKIYFGKDFLKGDFVKINGMLICGDNVKLLDYCYVVGTVVLFDNVKISSEVKNSIILRNTKSVHRNSYIGDSIIGEDVNIGGGTQFANLRMDEKEIILKNDENVLEKTGRRKFGAVVEDNCSFGVNVHINPGTYLDNGKRIIKNPNHLIIKDSFKKK